MKYKELLSLKMAVEYWGDKAEIRDGKLFVTLNPKRAPYVYYQAYLKEEDMNLEKEASKCYEDDWKEEVREIVREEVGLLFEPKDASELRFSKPILTDKENNILKGLYLLGWNWIARDKEGDISIYEKEPVRDSRFGNWSSTYKYGYIFHYPITEDEEDLFPFITWDNSPMFIADLIEEE